MTIKVKDLDKVEAWQPGSGGALLETGWHTVAIEQADEGTSSGGYDQIEMEFVAEGGASIREWLVILPQTLGKAKALLLAADLPEGKKSGEFSFPTKKLLGKRLDILVGEEPDFNDATKMRRRVQGHAPAGSKIDSANDLPDGSPGGSGDDDIPF